MRKLFTKYSDNTERSLRLSETGLRLPALKMITGQKAFSYRGAKLWNSLEREAKLAPFLKNFKKRQTSIVGSVTLISISISFLLYCKPHKQEHNKIRTCRLILWEKIPKYKNQIQTDLLKCSYEMVHLIKKFHQISVNNYWQLNTSNSFRNMQILLSSCMM